MLTEKSVLPSVGVAHVVDGQRDAVERDRALGGDDSGRAPSARGCRGGSNRRPAQAPTTSPTPSTWPVTIWPPSSSPILSARSRLRRAPSAATWPGAVRDLGFGRDVDREPVVALVDHGQADARAGDRGAEIDGRPCRSRRRCVRRRSPRCSALRTVPISVMIPVNIGLALVAHALVDFEPVDAKRARRRSAASGRGRRRWRRGRYSRSCDLPSPTRIGAR